MGEHHGFETGTATGRGSVTSERTTPGRGDRGVTPVLALVLIVGIVAVGSVGILLLGADTTGQARENGETERIEQGFLELDSDIDSVARSEDGVRRTNLELPDTGDAAVREESTGHIWVNRTNFSTGTTDVLVDREMGAIRYSREDGTTYALQAGGVWRGGGENTVMLSPPAFSYELSPDDTEPTLTVPIVSTTGDERLEGGDVTLRKKQTISPLNDITVVENDLVTLKVQSRWYVGWAKYFEQLTGQGSVTVDHANQTAAVELIVPASHPPVKGGIVNGAAAGDLTLSNTIAADSYDSSTPGGYDSATASNNTSVYVDGNLTLRNQADVQGNVVVGDKFTIKNTNSYVYGNVSHVGEYDLLKTWSHHIVDDPDEPRWQAPNATFGDRDSIDAIIDLKLGKVRGDNDNDEAGVPINSNDRLAGCGSGGGCTLGPGTYYLEEIALGSGDELILDTSAGGGDIDIAVNGTMELDGANVTVKGDGRVNVYVDSEDPATTDLLVKKSNVVDDDGGDDATNFWVYMDPDADAHLFKSTTRFVGVIYGPGTDGQSGTAIEIDNTVLIYGAVVGDLKSASNSAKIHYDEALVDTPTVVSGLSIPKLTFLHASVYEVEVDDD